MKDLFKAGDLAYVDPEEVCGLSWDEEGDRRSPVVLLKSGHSVRADKYKTTPRAEPSLREEVLLRLKTDLDAASWARSE